MPRQHRLDLRNQRGRSRAALHAAPVQFDQLAERGVGLLLAWEAVADLLPGRHIGDRPGIRRIGRVLDRWVQGQILNPARGCDRVWSNIGADNDGVRAPRRRRPIHRQVDGREKDIPLGRVAHRPRVSVGLLEARGPGAVGPLVERVQDLVGGGDVGVVVGRVKSRTGAGFGFLDFGLNCALARRLGPTQHLLNHRRRGRRPGQQRRRRGVEEVAADRIGIGRVTRGQLVDVEQPIGRVLAGADRLEECVPLAVLGLPPGVVERGGHLQKRRAGLLARGDIPAGALLERGTQRTGRVSGHGGDRRRHILGQADQLVCLEDMCAVAVEAHRPVHTLGLHVVAGDAQPCDRIVERDTIGVFRLAQYPALGFGDGLVGIGVVPGGKCGRVLRVHQKVMSRFRVG